MILSCPGDHLAFQIRNEFDKLVSVCRGRSADVIVFNGITLCSTSIKVGSIIFFFRAKYQGQGLERSIMGKRFFGPIAFRINKNCAQLQRGIVGNSKPPIGGNPFLLRIIEIAVNNIKKVVNFLRTGSMRAKPAVIRPICQVHPQIL